MPPSNKSSDSENVTKKQLNLRIKQETESHLKVTAADFGLYYNDEGSISGLLDKVGDRELAITQSDKLGGHSLYMAETAYNINYQILTKDYPGALAQVAGVFSDKGSRIIGLDSSPGIEGYYDNIIAHLPESTDPVTLYEALLDLTLNDVREYSQEKIERKYYDEPLLTEVECSISFEIQASSRLGLLKDLTLAIAKEGINLMTAFQDNTNISTYHFQLEFNKDHFKSRSDIKRLIGKLKSIESVQYVRQTNVNDILKHLPHSSKRSRS